VCARMTTTNAGTQLLLLLMSVGSTFVVTFCAVGVVPVIDSFINIRKLKELQSDESCVLSPSVHSTFNNSP
jgi:hypothetical protein